LRHLTNQSSGRGIGVVWFLALPITRAADVNRQQLSIGNIHFSALPVNG
jgi:hypothetical protein